LLERNDRLLEQLDGFVDLPVAGLPLGAPRQLVQRPREIVAGAAELTTRPFGFESTACSCPPITWMVMTTAESALTLAR
jgi:hypothetical protein